MAVEGTGITSGFPLWVDRQASGGGGLHAQTLQTACGQVEYADAGHGFPIRAPQADLRLDRLRLRGLNGVRDKFHLTASAQNLRKLTTLIPALQPTPA